MKHLGARSTRYAGAFAGAPVTITVDCGLEGYFIAHRVAERLGHARAALVEPFGVEVASDNLLRVSQASHRLCLKARGLRDRARRDIADIKGHEVILGIP